jgi:uracil-DNA glycosylase
MNFKFFQGKIDPSWWPVLMPFIEGEECEKIFAFLKKRKDLGFKICPDSSRVWNAFKYCKYPDLKVVMVGYDPYPQVINKIPVADGLAFSSSTTDKYPDSLKTLHDAINRDVYMGEETAMSNDLSFIAKQGVLMLNISLTVEENNIGVHSKEDLWLPLFKHIITHFNNFNNGIVYQLFGKEARKVKEFINKRGVTVLEEYHPSYFARNKKPMETTIFSETNDVIKKTFGEANQIFWDKGIMDNTIAECPF